MNISKKIFAVASLEIYFITAKIRRNCERQDKEENLQNFELRAIIKAWQLT